MTVAGLVALVVLLAGALGSGARAPRHPAPGARGGTATSGPIRLRYGSPWRLAAAGSSAGSFAIAGPLGLRSGAASLIAGPLIRSAPVPGGAPPQLVARLGEPATEGAIELGAHPARRYTWPLSGGRLLAAMVVPTTTADLALLCEAPAAVPAAMRPCLALAGTARLSSVHAIAPGELDTGPLGALENYWSDISVGDYTGAYRYLAPGAVNRTATQWAADERRTRISGIDFHGAVASISATAATVAIGTLVTRDAHTGCRTWSGLYDMTRPGAAWLISRSLISPRACAG